MEKNNDKNAKMRFVASQYDTSKGKQKDKVAEQKFARIVKEMSKKK